MTMASPYPGLRPFQQDEAHLFLSREAQIEDMLARLEDRRFLAVVGTSGCGKSSLVRAGLIPALEQGFLSDALPNWRMAVMRPGSAPFDNLAAKLLSEAALGHERQSASQAAALLQATLRRGPLGLIEAVAESHLPEGTNLLLVVDQFEELFRYRTQTRSLNDADAFVSLLLASAQSGQSEVPIYVVITMRSDFIGDCALFTGLPEAINDSQFLTPRLTRDQYRAAIVEPALIAGGQLTDTLVNRLLNDLRGEPDQLPVLQHALMRMWTQSTDGVPEKALTLEDYAAVGGLAGALSKHCDEILYNELNTEQQRFAQVMFRALCERSSEQRDTRRPAQLGEIAAIAGVDVEVVIPVVDAFRGAGRNFLMPPLPLPLDAETTLDISHESLIRQWQTLNTWVMAEAESARQYQRLEDAAKRRQQRAGAELWRGVDLENARVWREREKPTKAWAARYGDAYQSAMDFLTESEAEEEK
jgi:energy-coupling factor transporter ATP-binding protein EcfA2